MRSAGRTPIPGGLSVPAAGAAARRLVARARSRGRWDDAGSGRTPDGLDDRYHRRRDTGYASGAPLAEAALARDPILAPHNPAIYEVVETDSVDLAMRRVTALPAASSPSPSPAATAASGAREPVAVDRQPAYPPPRGAARPAAVRTRHAQRAPVAARRRAVRYAVRILELMDEAVTSVCGRRCRARCGSRCRRISRRRT